MPIEFITLPEGFSIELPSYNLVLNVSPFPTFKCLAIAEQPVDTNPDTIWIKFKPNLFLQFERSIFSLQCPLCGKPLGDQNGS
jgi:hypothetical protein